ncbi:hypothetical protein ACP275_01G064900 [Erythranthe tilingii]
MARSNDNSHVRNFTKSIIRKRCSTNIESLPDELVFLILLELPAEDIYDSAMLVCKKWYEMIDTDEFVHSHFQHSTPGLLIQNRTHKYDRAVFAAIRKGKIEISKFGYKFTDRALASCNGLVLNHYSENDYALQIVNPATKQRLFVTPPFTKKVSRHNSFGIVHVASTMAYKVFHTYFHYTNEYLYTWGCSLLTVGVDKYWRRVHIRPVFQETTIVHTTQQTTEGFMHWIWSNDCVLTLNVETEVITSTPVPRGCKHVPKWYLSKGKYLSLVALCGDSSFDVWEMKSETGEWTKTYKVDFEPLSKYGRVTPVAWLKHGEVLVLSGSDLTRVCTTYNVLTREIDCFELDDYCNDHIFKIHTNSLVSLDGIEVGY